MIRIGEIIDGRYEILKEIGRGGMSIVYLAMDNRLNKSIVVKEIRRRDNSNNKLLMDSLKQESDLLKFPLLCFHIYLIAEKRRENSG